MSRAKLYLAGGCFWGLEELLGGRPGVLDTEVGYTGGQNSSPTYRLHPGHAEVVELNYDPEQTTVDALLDYFFRIHDPTTLNRQGNDIGDSYRSAVFYLDDDQRAAAERAISRNQVNWPNRIVTTLEPLDKFWPAEPEHQDYLKKNPGGYSCHYERDFSK